VDTVLVRFLGDVDPKTSSPLFMFVRSFEPGPERALTMMAGDGRPNELGFTPPDPDGKAGDNPGPRRGRIDGDAFTGTKLGDYKPLGGMAQVAYFAQDRVLYRAIHAPVEVDFAAMLNPAAATPVIEDVLFFDVDYWGQDTTSWEGLAGRGGPERIWDSTRGLTTGGLRSFYLHRGPDSLNDPEDDVFPVKVRVTLCVDSPFPRCVFTKLSAETGEGDTQLFADSTRGFPEDNGFILIDKEWIRYRKKTDDSFVVERRGVRGTQAADHAEGALVRIGRTFTRTVFLATFREDFTPDRVWQQRRKRTRP
jgi:hypothetical protein